MRKSRVVFKFLVFSFVFCSCSLSKKNTSLEKTMPSATDKRVDEVTMLGKPKVLEIDILKNYFLKNTVVLSDTVNYYVFSEAKKFETSFGIAKTMTNEIESLDFKKNTVAAIILKPTNKKSEIIVDSVTQIGTGIRIAYSTVLGEETSYFRKPIKLVKLPKNKAIQSISFETKNEVVDTIILK